MSEQAFSKDVSKHGGYAYTTEKLSARMSNARISKSILRMTSFTNKTVLDIGCGDGAYSLELLQAGAKFVIAIDPVEKAIQAATEKYKNISNLTFECVDLYKMPILQEKFDIVILRGVLHHLPDLEKGIEIACKLGKKILIMEPNGYNPVLKIIEKTSKYHIEHHEQSFTPKRLNQLFQQNNGRVVFHEYIGLVPFFCPDSFTKILKFFEPLVESLPIVRAISCGQYMFAVDIQT